MCKASAATHAARRPDDLRRQHGPSQLPPLVVHSQRGGGLALVLPALMPYTPAAPRGASKQHCKVLVTDGGALCQNLAHQAC